MEMFVSLFYALDRTSKTKEKLFLLKRYFGSVSAQDGTWALFFLLGGKVPRLFTTTELRSIISCRTNLPLWLVEDSYDTVGDLAETLALLSTSTKTSLTSPSPLHLHQLVHRLQALANIEAEDEREALLWQLVESTPHTQRLILFKLMIGGLRIGVSKGLVTQALSELYEIELAEMAHRLVGEWTPSEEQFRALRQKHSTGESLGNPYPFLLASPLDATQEEAITHALSQWHIEWKWDGIRSQILKRSGRVIIWSRGEEVITETFPELVSAVEALDCDNLVLDGEIVVWGEHSPLPFGELQKRLNRKTVSARMIQSLPARFIAYDILEQEGDDIRAHPLATRRKHLEQLFYDNSDTRLLLSPLLPVTTPEELVALRNTARTQQAEGLMLKHCASPYGTGRRGSQWWKWKVDPLTLDVVLLYAQKGHGRRADLFSSYTFGVWNDKELVTITKAYSGLTNQEIREVDSFIRKNTTERFGPVHAVPPTLVFEIAFDSIQPSKRHKAGVALRFPRILRIRHDKHAHEADTIESAAKLLDEYSTL